MDILFFFKGTILNKDSVTNYRLFYKNKSSTLTKLLHEHLFFKNNKTVRQNGKYPLGKVILPII